MAASTVLAVLILAASAVASVTAAAAPSVSPAASSSGAAAVLRYGVPATTTRLHRIGRKRLGRAGGIVRARGGAALYVPPGVMRRRGMVTITPLPGGRIDFHISAPWRGNVAVTMPRGRRGRVVGHKIDGVWLPEGRPGQRTVWVSQLSPFDWIKAKAKAAACFLTLSKPKIVECLMQKLGTHVGKKVAQWIADKLGGSCYASLAAAGFFGPGTVALTAFMAPACVGHAGEGDFHFPTGPSQLPVGDNNGGSQTPTFNPQGPTTNPQGPTTNPQGPSPAPQPPPSQPPATGCNGAGGTSAGGPGNAGFHIGDAVLGGTWARTDPCDGTWHSKGNRPGNGAYWYPNGLGVGVDCARTGAAYTVHWADGHTETWNTWFHVTDGKWFPSAAAQETMNNSFYGLPAC